MDADNSLTIQPCLVAQMDGVCSAEGGGLTVMVLATTNKVTLALCAIFQHGIIYNFNTLGSFLASLTIIELVSLASSARSIRTSAIRWKIFETIFDGALAVCSPKTTLF